jgi:hypothetical protein
MPLWSFIVPSLQSSQPINLLSQDSACSLKVYFYRSLSIPVSALAVPSCAKFDYYGVFARGTVQALI